MFSSFKLKLTLTLKNTWLVKCSSHTIKLTQELYFFCISLSNYFFDFFFLKKNLFSTLFVKNLSLFFFCFNNSLKRESADKLSFYYQNPDNLKFIRTSVFFKGVNLFNEKFEPKKFNNYKPLKRKWFTYFTNVFFLYNISFESEKFVCHHTFRAFSVYNISGNFVILSFRSFVLKWTDGYSLLFNFYYYNLCPLIFGTPVFKKEILALNWKTNLIDSYTWKHSFPFFIFKLNNFNQKIDFFLQKLEAYNANLFLVTDCTYHYKLINYFSRNYFFTLGLTSANLDPWLVSYSLPILSDNYFLQLFFLKLIILIQKFVFLQQYSNRKSLWAKIFLANACFNKFSK